MSQSTASEYIEIVETTVTIEETVTFCPLFKKCVWCKEWKALEDFHKDKQRKDGHQNKCKVCVKKNIKLHRTSYVYESAGLRGHWSKYGGSRVNVVQAEIVKNWFCQSCGFKYPIEINPYRYQLSEDEYIRACASCYADGCLKLRKRMDLNDLY